MAKLNCIFGTNNCWLINMLKLLLMCYLRSYLLTCLLASSTPYTTRSLLTYDLNLQSRLRSEASFVTWPSVDLWPNFENYVFQQNVPKIKNLKGKMPMHLSCCFSYHACHMTWSSNLLHRHIFWVQCWLDLYCVIPLHKILNANWDRPLSYWPEFYLWNDMTFCTLWPYPQVRCKLALTWPGDLDFYMTLFSGL